MAEQNGKLNLTEHVETLFEGVEGVTDEQKTKMETVLEAAVTSIVAKQTEQIQEAADAKVEELVEQQVRDINATVEKYLDYTINEWMDENKLAVESGLKVEQSMKFFEGLKSLFVENNIAIPEGKDDLVEAQENQIADLQEKLNASTAKVIDLSEQISKHDKGAIIALVSEGLTDTEKEKFNTLVEGLEFGDTESFKTKCETVRSTYFKAESLSETANTKKGGQLNESNDDPVANRLESLRNPYA